MLNVCRRRPSPCRGWHRLPSPEEAAGRADLRGCPGGRLTTPSAISGRLSLKIAQLLRRDARIPSGGLLTCLILRDKLSVIVKHMLKPPGLASGGPVRTRRRRRCRAGNGAVNRVPDQFLIRGEARIRPRFIRRAAVTGVSWACGMEWARTNHVVRARGAVAKAGSEQALVPLPASGDPRTAAEGALAVAVVAPDGAGGVAGDDVSPAVAGDVAHPPRSRCTTGPSR